MSEKFMQALEQETNLTTTENGAVAFASSMNALVDLFANGAAMRGRTEKAREELFAKAFNVAPEDAVRTLFYLRDVRGGQGERDFFRIALNYLAKFHERVAKQMIRHVPEFGRYDDLFVLFGHSEKLNNITAWFIARQLQNDLRNMELGEPVSLLAKWLPTLPNTKHRKVPPPKFQGDYKLINPKFNREIAIREVIKALAFMYDNAGGCNYKKYRRMLSALRKHLDIVETKLPEKNYQAIDYSKLSSQANLKYRQAFRRHDDYRYSKFLEALAEGKTKVNSSTVYPAELVYSIRQEQDARLINGMWENLPDYVQGKENALVVADVSGSMFSSCISKRVQPIDVSVSLAIYLAERNTSKDYRNKFITFSAHPKLNTLVGNTFAEKYRNVIRSDWGYNTNLVAVFDLVLQVALKNNLTQDEMVDKLYVVSDMQFDDSFAGKHSSFSKESVFQTIKETFNEHGYEAPELIFWNVNAASKAIPVKYDTTGTKLVSGYSPSIFKYLMNDETTTPLEFVYEVIHSERYKDIRISI